MRSPYQVVLRPLLTEKGTRLKEAGNQYLFRVAKTANKIEIKQAI
ncbi:MAG: 50S ribosomal protein L23, partial [candidate division NC10 bacterium]